MQRQDPKEKYQLFKRGGGGGRQKITARQRKIRN
jgi:hypothetical protein